MSNLKSFKIKLLFLFILSMLVNACGGGGSSDDERGGVNPPPVSGNINGGLTGRIFMNNGWIIDIPTGRSKRVPGVYWDDYCYEYNPTDDPGHDFLCTTSNPEIERNSYTSYYGTPNLTDEEYLLTVSTCKYGRGTVPDSDCLEIRNIETGELIGNRLVRDEIINYGAKFSRDGQYYAFTHNDIHAYSNTSFVINNKIHEKITSITMQKKDSMPFDWGPSGEIVLTYDGAIYLTPPYSLDGNNIFDLTDHPELTSPAPDSGQAPVVGIAGNLRISPDGSKIAFRLNEGDQSLHSASNTPWIMNIDGTDLHRLAHTPESGSFNNLFGPLAWSPDGEYILITEGYHVTGTNVSGGSDFLYAIPSDSRDIELNKEGKNGIILIRTNYKVDNQEVLDIFYGGSGFWWLP
jgi:hypothetical protein